jgi:hypothetical protein
MDHEIFNRLERFLATQHTIGSTLPGQRRFGILDFGVIPKKWH